VNHFQAILRSFADLVSNCFPQIRACIAAKNSIFFLVFLENKKESAKNVSKAYKYMGSHPNVGIVNKDLLLMEINARAVHYIFDHMANQLNVKNVQLLLHFESQWDN
jgi:hypothetical protein